MSSFSLECAKEIPPNPILVAGWVGNGHKKHKRHKKGSKAKQGVKKRPQYGWNCGAARNHSMGRRIHFFSFCVSVPFVVFAFDGKWPQKHRKGSKTKQGITKGLPSVWNLGVIRNHPAVHGGPYWILLLPCHSPVVGVVFHILCFCASCGICL